MGLPGSGKSFFASQLAKILKAEYLNSDKIRKEICAHCSYSVIEKEGVYAAMLTCMKQAVAERKDVVVDATFYTKRTRKQLLAAARPEKNVFFMEIYAGEQLIRERLQHPRVDSEADIKVYKLVRSQWEPIEEPHFRLLSTSTNIAEMLDKALRYLRVNIFPEHDKRTGK